MKLIVSPRAASLRSTPRSHRVLAIVGDTQVGLWVTRSLGRAGLKVFSVCRSAHGLAAHSRYSSGAWAQEVGASDGRFGREIETLARELDVGSIMTIAEGYHAALNRCRERFEPNIHLFSPSAEQFAKATDKGYMNRLARRVGVAVARGATLEKVIAGAEDTQLQFPLVLRTRRQNDPATVAPWKAAYAETPRQLARLHEEVAAIADNVLVQEYHPGVEDHVQILMHDGRPFMVGEYIGEHHMPLAGGVTVLRVTCRHAGLIRDAVRLLQAIGWEGMAGVQFHYDPATGRYIFLEVNPRFIGGLPTLVMAGFDAPFLLWQSRFQPNRMVRGTYQLGRRTRIMGGDANWMFGMIRGDPLPPGQKRLGKLAAMWQFAWNFGPWTADDVFCLGDAKPALIDWRQMLKRLRAETYDIIGNTETQKEPA